MNQLAVSDQHDLSIIQNIRPVELPDYDLSLVLERVQHDHPDWSSERLAAAKLDYLRYLALCKLDQEAALIPTLDADEVWHTHILHTKQYREDSNKYFGYFLDHDPFNRSNEKFPIDHTAKLYFQTFGVEYNIENLAECTNCNCKGGNATRVKCIQ